MWALIPGALAVFVAFQSISATLVAIKLEKVDKPPEPSGSARERRMEQASSSFVEKHFNIDDPQGPDGVLMRETAPQ
jgi:hypothetical protein